MKVKAKPGVLVPREENARRYVSDKEALEVAETAYYLRRIADGDLERITETKADDVAAAPVATKALPAEKVQTASSSEDNGDK